MGLAGHCDTSAGMLARSRRGSRQLLALALVIAPAVAPAKMGRFAIEGRPARAGAQAAAGGDARQSAAHSRRIPLTSDPLRLARYVDREGDAAVLAALAPGQPALMRQLGSLATPYMRAPHGAVPSLVRLMASRDPDVAPSASIALAQIVVELPPGTLADHLLSPAQLRSVLSALKQLAESGHVRPDVALSAAVAEATLRDRLKLLGFTPESSAAETGGDDG